MTVAELNEIKARYSDLIKVRQLIGEACGLKGLETLHIVDELGQVVVDEPIGDGRGLRFFRKQILAVFIETSEIGGESIKFINILTENDNNKGSASIII